MVRRLKDAKINFVSLCKRGKNRVRTIFKEDGSFELGLLTKALDRFDEKGQLVACVYPADRLDTEGDWAPPEEVEKMAHRFLRDGGGIDLRHDGKRLTTEQAFPAESFVIQKGDPRFQGITDYEGKAVDVTNGWGMVIQINDQALRKAYRDGEWDGVSMGGEAIAIRGEGPPGDSVLADKMDRVLAALGKNEEIDMTRTELEKVLDEREEKLVDKLTKALKGETKETEKVTKTDDAPDASKVDFSDPEQVEKYLEDLEFAKVDKSDPKAVKAHLDKIKARKAADGKDGDGKKSDADKDKSPELLKAEADLKKAEEELKRVKKSSNQPGGDGSGDSNTDVAKDAGERTKLGKCIGQYVMGGENAVADFLKKSA